MKFLKWALAGFLAIVTGCMFAFVVWAWPALYVPPVRDFRLVGVERVASTSIGPCADEGIFCLKTLPYEEYLRIRVATDRNLMDLAVGHELNIWHDVWSCNSVPDRYAAGEFIAAGLYVEEYALPYGSRTEAERFYAATGRTPGAPMAYDIYLVPRWDRASNARESGKKIAPPYDVADGRDVCLRIGGGNMLGGHFVGNTVRISSAQLRSALAGR